MKRVCLFIIISLFAQLSIADVLGEYFFMGTLGDKIPIELAFSVNGEYLVVGEITYTKNKNAKPILLVGDVNDDGLYTIAEYMSDGNITGWLSFRINDSFADGPVLYDGTWTNPKNYKSYEINVRSDPDSYKADYSRFYEYATPEEVAGEYQYRESNAANGQERMGYAKFTNAGEHKLNFDISVVTPNIAEGHNAPDRPAVLGKFTYNFFYYENLNDCGYGFSAHFYKRFVVIRTISPQPESINCFGMGATLEGVYIKTNKK
ncbi:MAG: hypothetical protein IKX51_06425 [Bacteroidales bacterium]|nr:hypothetical protein [Bacteroidales bacterium]